MANDTYVFNGYIKEGNLHMIAGIKGVGKTRLLVSIAEQYRKINDSKKVLFYYFADNNDMTGFEIDGIDFRECMNTGTIFLETGWIRNDFGLSAVIIDDYRFLLRKEIFRGTEFTKREKIIFILTRLKTLADVYDIPVILSCGVDDDYIYGRIDKQPKILDVTDYECVESIVDKLILMNRDELYCNNSEKHGIADFKVYDLVRKTCNDYKMIYLSKEKRFCNAEIPCDM